MTLTYHKEPFMRANLTNYRPYSPAAPVFTKDPPLMRARGGIPWRLIVTAVGGFILGAALVLFA